MPDTFSRRHQLDNVAGDLQYGFVPTAFRLEIYTLIGDALREENEENSYVREYAVYRDLAARIGETPGVLCTSEDQVYEYYKHELLISLLHDAEWHEVLTMVEDLARSGLLAVKRLNHAFAAHRLGYKLEDTFDGYSVEIQYEAVAERVEAVEAALGPHADIKDLLAHARQDLVNPTSVSAAAAASNAVKALEAFVKRWLIDQGIKAPATLGDAIKLMENAQGKLGEPTFVAAMKQLYIWRNRTPHVAHGGALKEDEALVQPNEALLVLDMATAFINYLFRLRKPQPN